MRGFPCGRIRLRGGMFGHVGFHLTVGGRMRRVLHNSSKSLFENCVKKQILRTACGKLGMTSCVFPVTPQPSSEGVPGLGGMPDFLPRLSSQNAFKKKTPERLSMIRLSKRPSTVVNVPETAIHAMPARGIRPSTMEIKSITASKSPPHTSAEELVQSVSCYGLKVTSTVLLSFAASVTF